MLQLDLMGAARGCAPPPMFLPHSPSWQRLPRQAYLKKKQRARECADLFSALDGPARYAEPPPGHRGEQCVVRRMSLPLTRLHCFKW